MEKINVAELLRNCPKGMKLDCTIYEDVVFHDIVDRHYPIRVRRKKGGLINLNAYGCMDDKIDSKCVIFPKGKTTWEGFQGPFKKGDIVVNNSSKRPFIYKGKNKDYYECYVGLTVGFNLVKECSTWIDISRELRPATEEEKEKLFEAIKANGYKWNPETKTLETLVEPEFKDGDILSYQCAGLRNRTIYIYRHHPTMNTSFYVALGSDLEFMVSRREGYALSGNNTTARLATKDEKEKLFQAIKDKGYRWNEETKTLEKLNGPKFKVGDRIRNKTTNRNYIITHKDNLSYYVDNSHFAIWIKEQDEWELVPDKFDINTLKPFESRVLVWEDQCKKWIPAFWGSKCDSGGYITTYGWCKYCIPFDGNEHLTGTSKDCDKFYKTWK